MKKCRIGLLLLLISYSLISWATQPPTPVVFWHSMAGNLSDIVNQLAQQFNDSQQRFRVIPVYKGSYAETMTSTVAAFRARQQPAIVQIFEVGTSTMMHPEGIIVPFYQLMADANIKVKDKDFLPAVHSYYVDQQGRLVALPFNSSSAVLYYNKDAFVKARLNPNKPPTTWPQVKHYAEKIVAAGYKCGVTTAWPSWIQLETFSAWHNQPLATQHNGFAGLDAQFVINNPVVLHHLTELAKWQRQHLFQYGGRGDDATALFTSEHCAMIMASSGSLVSFKELVPFKLGVGPLPYWPQVKGAPQNTIIGGAALWALRGHSAEVYRGVAAFFQYLLSPAVQVQWQRATGYIPVTYSAYRLSKQQGYYRQYPGAKVAINELTLHKPGPNSKGLRLGNYMQIREVFDQELEAVWSGIKTPQQALEDATKRGNHLLGQFKRNIELPR